MTEEPKQETKFRRRVLIWVSALLLLTLGFGGGYFVRGLDDLTVYLGFPIVSGSDSVDVSRSSSELGERIEEAQGILASEASTPADLETATAAAIQALVQDTGDIYGKYFSESQYQSYLNQNDGEFGGIGVLLSEYDGKAYIVRVFEGTPAEAAGLQEGDFITSVNGDVRSSWSSEEVVALIGGEPGTLVELGWRRPLAKDDAGGEAFSAVMECATIEIPNITYSLVGNVGYISISQFTRKSTEQVQAAIVDLASQGAQGYLVDLRGNPGGYLTQAVEITSMFLREGTVVQVDSRTAGLTKTQVTSNFLTDKPLTILVNENSASAAEIMTTAMQDHGRATIVGVTTFGKGTVQTIKELSFGGGIKYTIARYLSPDGDEIDGIGVTPDIIVEMDSSLRGSGDSDVQYLAALADIQQQIANVQAQETAAATAGTAAVPTGS
ncbi:MAG: S41 family peptidase [Actinobacteria bacterium]|nr:S41 family peptidase [Actinomycetota bacterium]